MNRTFIMLMGTLLSIVVATWIGVSVYSAQINVDVSPEAAEYTKQIQSSFNTAVLEDLEDRIRVLRVSPDVFHNLTYSGATDGESGDEQNNAEQEEETSKE